MLFLFSLCAPLLGTFLTPFLALFVVGISLLFKNGVSVYFITFGIPTLVATICWIVERQNTTPAKVAKILLNVMLPLACIIAFAIHPVGNHAIAYSLYWLIPPMLLFASREGREGILNPSIRITFITHALGSILWLYALPTTPIFWLALIPVVAVERFCFASITAIALSLIKIVEHRYNLVTSKNLTN